MIDTDASLLAELLHRSVQQGSMACLTISGSSMAPLLKHGDRIRLEAAATGCLQIGDIVTVTAGSYLLTHRFWGSAGQKPGFFTSRGDRCLMPDPPWPAEALIGRVVARCRNGQELPLAVGPGGRLNRYLARLAAAEWGWLLANREHRPQTLQIRLLRRAISAGAGLAMSLTEMFFCQGPAYYVPGKQRQ